jgi:prepilin-type N-terminal cleavage/methylation domain-containing protein
MKQWYRAEERGVTLIEMLVVVVVIAIIMSISTPSVTAGIDAVRLNTASSSVAVFLNAADNRAERSQRPVELIVSGKLLQYISTDAGSHRELVLPDGITAQVAGAPGGDDPQTAGRILFMPGGAVPAVAIGLSNQHGGRRIIRLDPMTGAPHVEHAESVQAK